MILPPAVMIHGVAHARAACAPGLPVTLLSGPGAGLYAGVGWWRAMIVAADVPPGVPDILDCADAPGRALEALRGGQRVVILRCPPVPWQDVADRARALGACLMDVRPAALDLDLRGADRRLAAWLKST